MSSRLVQVSATGAVVTTAAEGGPLFLKSLTLTAAAAAATATIEDSAAGGETDVLTLAAPINTSVTWRAGDGQGAAFLTAIHATLSGAGALLGVEYGRQ